MKCLSPISVPNKNPMQPGFIRVPCGKCEACAINRASQWYTRLLQQWRDSDSCKFVTLTYAPENLVLRLDDRGYPVADVSKYDVRHFIVRLRRYLGSAKSKRLKYFLVSEYGPNPENGVHRPHYHAIFFNLAKEDIPILEFAWSKGFVNVSEVTCGRLKYVSGYSTEKLFCPTGVEPLFTFISNGIGVGYIDAMRDYHSGQIDRAFVPLDGRKRPMPRYYKDRLYTESERKIIADDCVKRADKVFDNDLKRCGGDMQLLFRKYHDQRADFVRKVRKSHKKKYNG